MVDLTPAGDPRVMVRQANERGRLPGGRSAKARLRSVRLFAIPLAIAGAAALLSRLSAGLAWGLIVCGIALLAIAAEARSGRP